MSSDTPIFDQLVAEFELRQGRKFNSLLAPKAVNPAVITKRPTTPFKADEEAATVQMPRVVPLSQLNKVA